MLMKKDGSRALVSWGQLEILFFYEKEGQSFEKQTTKKIKNYKRKLTLPYEEEPPLEPFLRVPPYLSSN